MTSPFAGHLPTTPNAVQPSPAGSNDVFVAVGGQHGDPNGDGEIVSSPVVLVSEDGLTWDSESASASGRLEMIAFGDGAFVAAERDGRVHRSADGRQWSEGAQFPALPDPLDKPALIIVDDGCRNGRTLSPAAKKIGQ